MTRRAAAIAAAVLAAAACSRTKHVRAPEQEAEQAPRRGGGRAGLPAQPGRPPVPAAPQGLLEKGTVARIQRALADRGLLKEHQDGELDDATSAAIRKLQAGSGLAATGFPDRETLKELGIDPEHAYVREEDRKRQEGERGAEGGGEGGRDAGERARGSAAGR